MAKVLVTDSSDRPKKRRPALTPEARESQMISYAIDLAEKQLIEGTASSQVITHYLKLGTTRERIEKEILEKQAKLIDAKVEDIQSRKSSNEKFDEAIRAFKRYSGQADEREDDDDYEDW